MTSQRRWEPIKIPRFDLFNISDGQLSLPISSDIDHAEFWAIQLNNDRDRLAQAGALLRRFLQCMDTHGDWDEGCFYYSHYAAPELQGPISDARAFLKEQP